MSELIKAVNKLLATNGGPIDGADTDDGNEYVMVRMDAFRELERLAVDAATPTPAPPLPVAEGAMREKNLATALMEFVRVEGSFGHTGQHTDAECADCRRVHMAHTALSLGFLNREAAPLEEAHPWLKKYTPAPVGIDRTPPAANVAVEAAEQPRAPMSLQDVIAGLQAANQRLTRERDAALDVARRLRCEVTEARSDAAGWERWLTEVLTDFKIQFDDHRLGQRLALTQWMRDGLELTNKYNEAREEVKRLRCMVTKLTNEE